LSHDDPPDEQARPEGDEPEGSAALEASAEPTVSMAPAEVREPVVDVHQARARLAEDRLAEVLGAYRELKSENEDYRERIARNVERRFEQRREGLLLKFIDVLDNLDRALEAVQTNYAGDALIEGMILVRTHLLQTLQIEGLERIPVLGLPFDPHLSESVSSEAVTDPEHDHLVVKELMRGYRINGRIARPARVVIGLHGGPPTDPSTTPSEPTIG